MKLDVLAETALDAATETEIGALLDLCFDGGFEGRSFFLQRHHLRVLAREDGRIVGHLALGLRLIRQGARLIEVATVAEVAVAPGARGKGIGAAMLAAGIGAAQRTRAAFMLLYGANGLYHGAGFCPVDNIQRRVDMAGRRSTGVLEGPVAELMVLPLGAERWDGDTPIDLLGAVF